MYVTAEPWPGIPIRKGNKRQKAADIADGTWPDLVGKIKPHDYRHTHATWLDTPEIPKVLQMDRRGHAMSGMDATYIHPTDEMRQNLCNYLQRLWDTVIAERYAMTPRSAVPLLDEAPIAHENSLKGKRAPSSRTREATETSDVLLRARRQPPQAGRGRARD